MPLDPCEDGCLNHNMAATALPTAGDDPCNSAGNGYFCPGSFWYLAGGLVAGEDCDVLFLRTGGDCNVDQWLRIPLGNVRDEVVDPVDGVDCCSAGTIWCNSTDGTVWISTNGCGGDLCTWCEICEDHLVIAQRTATPFTAMVFPMPAVPTLVSGPSCFTVTNTSNKTLEGIWMIGGPCINFTNTDPDDSTIEVMTEFSSDGGATWNTVSGLGASENANAFGTPGDHREGCGASYYEVVNIAPGVSQTFCIRNFLWSNLNNATTGVGFVDNTWMAIFANTQD